MKEQDELKLDVLDAIDDTLLEEHTARRISLLAGAARRAKRRRLLRGACACAASIVLFFAIAIPIWIWGGKQVPVGEGIANIPAIIKRLHELGYEGPMTIEREISGEQQKRDIADARDLLIKWMSEV